MFNFRGTMPVKFQCLHIFFGIAHQMVAAISWTAIQSFPDHLFQREGNQQEYLAIV